MKIERLEHLSASVEALMREDMMAYETSHGVDVNYQPFSLVMKEDSGQVIAVLNAFTAYSEVYIDDLWVHSSHRGRGYGKALIENLETEFEGKGFNNINLVTSAFQAPEFYKKCGFSVEFIRKNLVNPKLSKTFLIKYFRNKDQRAGLIEDSVG